MKSLFLILLISICFFFGFVNQKHTSPKSLFDGKTFNGWEGDINETWYIENGCIVGGSTDKIVPKNNFLCTTRSYSNFVLELKIKLIGEEGFINSGIQFRSKRLTDPAHEMIGYQADWGKGYWASLYDESRRNKTLIKPDSVKIMQWIKINDWNDYKIWADRNRIRLFINGKQTVDYIEKDSKILQEGLIGFQIHGGGKAKVYIKDIRIQELP